MIEGARRMACGDCGCRSHHIFRTQRTVYTECVRCKTVTSISPTVPRLELEHVEGDGGGSLALFSGEEGT